MSAVKYLSDCFTVFQFFGLSPFSIKKLKPESQARYPSARYTVCFVFLFFILIIEMTMITINGLASADDHNSINAKSFLFQIINHSIFLGVVFIILVTLSQSYASTPLTKAFYLNCLKMAKMCIDDSDFSIDYRQIRRYFIKNFLKILILNIGSELLLYLANIYFNEPYDMLIACVFFLPIFFGQVTAFKFAFMVKLVNEHLDTIFHLLSEVFKPRLTVFKVKKVLGKPLSVNKFLDYATRIKNIRRMYNVCFKNAEIINRSMGITILCTMALNVVAILATLYRIFLSVFGKYPVEKLGG